jgi:hypothetical protein
MEVVTYSYTITNSILNNIGWFFEDSLEMMGILTMIGAATYWLKKQNCFDLSFKKWPAIVVCLIGLIDFIVYFFINIF